MFIFNHFQRINKKAEQLSGLSYCKPANRCKTGIMESRQTPDLSVGRECLILQEAALESAHVLCHYLRDILKTLGRRNTYVINIQRTEARKSVEALR